MCILQNAESSKIFKDLGSEDEDEEGLVNRSSRILEDDDFRRGQQLWLRYTAKCYFMPYLPMVYRILENDPGSLKKPDLLQMLADLFRAHRSLNIDHQNPFLTFFGIFCTETATKI